MSRHLDLDALADALVGEDDGPGAAHLAGCGQCRAALAELEQAQSRVRTALLALPEPAVPDDLAARLDAALLRAREADVITLHPRRALPKVLAVAAGVAAVLALGGVVWSALPSTDSQDSTASSAGSATSSAASSAASGGGPAQDSAGSPGAASPRSGSSGSGEAPRPFVVTREGASGTDYSSGVAALDAALPRLLGRVPLPSGAEAGVVTPVLAEGCAAELSGAPSRTPLAIDLGSYRGAPAVVVVFASAAPGRVDVYVAGRQCRAGDPQLLLHADLPLPG